MGGSSSKHEETHNTIDPMQMQQYQQNYADAQQRIGSLTPYSGQITAGFNPNQTQAQGILSGIATDPRYQATNQQAIGAVNGVLGNPLTASQISSTDLSPYMNPFTKDVIGQTISQQQYARDQQGVLDNASATAAHAFGGSRQGVQRALTTEGYDRNTGGLIAGLNSDNFNQARSAAATDVASQNAMKQFNTNTQLTGANQLANLNNNGLSLATQQGGILSAVGDAQQQQQQTELSNAYNAYLQGQQLTLTQQQMLNQALGIIPVQTNSTSDSTTKSNPGALGILGGIANLGLAAATGGSSLGLTGALGGLGGLFGNSLKGQSSGPSMGWT